MKFERPLTYLITKGELTPENFEDRKGELLETVAAAARTGISMVQIREKQLTAKQLFELSCDAASIVSGSETKLLVNGRPDIARVAGADGVHLPENGLPIVEVRRKFQAPFVIGASVHSIEAALRARGDGADFVVFGAVFDSGEKKGKGIDELKAVCDALDNSPVIAVGGIDESNREDVLAAGAAGYAAIRYLNQLVSAR